MLFYRYLLNCGFSHHEIRVEQSPSGRGSAENWVRKRFVQEVSVDHNNQIGLGMTAPAMVDEETDYKQPSAEWTELIRSAAKALCAAAMPNSDPPAYYVDSLQIGIKELKQLRS